jgi:lysozyme
MKTSRQGIDLLMAREGKRNKAYLDSRGIPTIGVGHTGPEVHLGLVWTDEQVAAAFAADLVVFEAAVEACVKVPLSGHQFDALVSFSYNCGRAALARGGSGNGPSGILCALNAGDYAGAAAAFDDWHFPPEIASRRNGEREQFKGTRFEPRMETVGMHDRRQRITLA